MPHLQDLSSLKIVQISSGAKTLTVIEASFEVEFAKNNNLLLLLCGTLPCRLSRWRCVTEIARFLCHLQFNPSLEIQNLKGLSSRIAAAALNFQESAPRKIKAPRNSRLTAAQKKILELKPNRIENTNV